MREPVRIAIFVADLPVPSPSPACLKLMTWLNMEGIPYEVVVPGGPPRSKTGKVPYLELPSGETVAESQVIMERLAPGGIDPHLSPVQRATSLAMRRMVEDHLYFATLAHRWLDDASWPATVRAYFGKMPWLVRWVIPWFLRRGVRRDAWGQGLARRPLPEVYAEGVRDIEALSLLLGEQDFFFGRPSSLDAVVFGTLANIWISDSTWEIRQSLAKRPNLVAWLDRMAKAYWPGALAELVQAEPASPA